MNSSVKAWYRDAYPSDELGEELNISVTFKDVIQALERGEDVYDLLWVGDSIVRERVFGELAKRLAVKYDYVYDLWLGF